MKDSSFNPQNQEQNLSSKIVAGLERISEVFKVLLWEQATAVGLSPIQIQILIFIAYHKPELCNVSHLAREFNITKPTVSDAIRVLGKKKLIIKDHSLEDRRSYTILLSPEGEDIVHQTSQFTLPMRRQVGQFTTRELEDLWTTLSALIYQLNRSGTLSVQRTCYGCRFFDKNHTDGAYCLLLKKRLLTQDIRLDCPEYEKKKQPNLKENQI